MPEDSEELAGRIREIIVERLFLEIEPDDIGEDDSLTDAYGVDSVRLFDMIVGLEEDFGVSFEDEELKLKNFDTVGAIAARVAAKLE
jgi:acyl carrier protein